MLGELEERVHRCVAHPDIVGMDDHDAIRRRESELPQGGIVGHEVPRIRYTVSVTFVTAIGNLPARASRSS